MKLAGQQFTAGVYRVRMTAGACWVYRDYDKLYGGNWYAKYTTSPVPFPTKKAAIDWLQSIEDEAEKAKEEATSKEAESLPVLKEKLAQLAKATEKTAASFAGLKPLAATMDEMAIWDGEQLEATTFAVGNSKTSYHDFSDSFMFEKMKIQTQVYPVAKKHPVLKSDYYKFN